MSRGAPGLFVFPEHFQSDGVTRVLDNIQLRMDVASITTQPYVMAPTDSAEGELEPPQDGGAGAVRRLSRRLWGADTLRVVTAPSYAPDLERYRGQLYRPPRPTPLTGRAGHVIDDLIEEAAKRGIEVYLQIQAASPPGIRVQFSAVHEDDRQRLPDGSLHEGRVDRNGSIASPNIVAYGVSLIADLAARYPGLAGFRLDWPEHPPYSFESVFFDFSHNAASAAEGMGLDFERMRRDCNRLLQEMRRDHETLFRFISAIGGEGRDDGPFESFPGLADLFRLKRRGVEAMLKRYDDAVKRSSGGRMTTSAMLFPPPFNVVSGVDFESVGRIVDSLCIKQYTMHWPMIMRNYIAWAAGSAGAGEARVIAAMMRGFDVMEEPFPADLDGVRYPAPHEAHPASDAVLKRKIEAVKAACGEAGVFALVHGYGPDRDFERRLAAAREASAGAVLVNRYSYLSDEKLSIIGRQSPGPR